MHTHLQWLLLLMPLGHFLAAMLTAAQRSAEQAWRVAEFACWLALLAVLTVTATLVFQPWLDPHATLPTLLRHAGGDLPVRLDMLSLAMANLIAILGLVVTRFSRQYLHGEPGSLSFQRWLSSTLGCVAITITSDHLLLLLAGWVCTSLCLHQLLLFYPDRPRARLAAQKKFIASRLGELCLLGAFVLLYLQHDSFIISSILASFADGGSTVAGWQTQLAALLIVLAALLKCAQLPLHGWLMQVMEAPTPVSALLHAGIINLGGFLLLLLAPVVEQSVAALWLLLVVAGITTLVASLSMMTRISIKVMLAWSTCAQMGFMLVECALGLYELALLHLLAHSIYKANAFLNAGNAVQDYLRHRLANDPAHAARQQPVSWLRALLPAVSILLLLVAALEWWQPQQHHPAMLLMLGFALSCCLLEAQAAQGRTALLLYLSCALLPLLYFVWQAGFVMLLPPHSPVIGDGMAAISWMLLLLLLFFAAFLALRCRPQQRAVQCLFLYLYGGLFVDEWMTRLTLRLWPRQRQRAASHLATDRVRS